MKKPIFVGAATALITPFAGGKVDKTAFAAIIEEQITAGISALVVCGTTGEAATMTDDEQIDAISFAVEKTRGRVPVIAGAGSNSTAHAAELCRRSEDAGADALLCVTPYYNKTSQAGLVKMYQTLADSVKKPIIIYNVPSRTGINVEPQTYAALADHPNIYAIKEAGGNISKFAETMALVGDKLAVYSGNDDQTIPMMSLGAMGVISVLSNVLPAEVSRMCKLFLNGNLHDAAKLQLRYIPLINALFSDVNPIPVKEAMAMLGKCSPEMRLPLVATSDEKRENLRTRLAAEGFGV